MNSKQKGWVSFALIVIGIFLAFWLLGKLIKFLIMIFAPVIIIVLLIYLLRKK